MGEPGPGGNKGPTGAPGPVGPQGLAGGKGPTGDQGSAGAAGPAGPSGSAGEPGASGPAGPAGATGPAGTRSYTALSAGPSHTCGINANGGAECWGANGNGQLGNGTTLGSLVPLPVPGLESGVTSIGAGGNANGSFTCAVRAGAATCWGYNGQGQLGDGTSTQRLTPTASAVLTGGVTEIDAGGAHACAIRAGAALCWGEGASGRLGDDSSTSSPVPVAVDALVNLVTRIDAGSEHTCAVHDGAAKCWGESGDVFNRLGVDPAADSDVPVQVTGLTAGVTDVAAGGAHSCAVHNGAAKCWGNGPSGELGNSTGSSTPLQVLGGLTSGVTDVTAGTAHSCAVHNGAAKCWGNGASGRLGNNSNANVTTPATAFGLGTGIVAIVAGDQHTCAVQANGTARCWGNGANGRLGDNTTTTTNLPVTVF